MSLIRDDPLVVAGLRVEQSLLQRAQLQCESRAQFCKFCPFSVLGELVAMVPEEDVVALVVERAHAPPSKLWIVVEQRAQHATDAEAEPCGEVGQDHLGSVARKVLVALPQLIRQLHVAQLEVRRRTIGQVDYEQSVRLLVVLVNDHHVREVLSDRTLAQLLGRHPVAQCDRGVGNDAEKFPGKDTTLLARTVRVRDEHLGFVLFVEVAAELVQIQILVHLVGLCFAQFSNRCVVGLSQGLDGVRGSRFVSFSLPSSALRLLFLLLLQLRLLEQLVAALLVLNAAEGILDNLKFSWLAAAFLSIFGSFSLLSLVQFIQQHLPPLRLLVHLWGGRHGLIVAGVIHDQNRNQNKTPREIDV